MGLLDGDPRELRGWLFAKKAVALVRISRSIRGSRFSFRSLANSSRSVLVRPVRPETSPRPSSSTSPARDGRAAIPP